MTNFTASGHQLVTRQRNGKDGRSVSKVDVVYQRSTSATSVPTTWVTTAPKLPKGYYLWSATKVTYKEADGKTTTEVIGAQCIASADNLKTTVERYAQTTSRTTPPDNSSSAWQEGDTSGVQAKDGYYTWTQTKIVWQDGTITYTTPICITGDKGETGHSGEDALQYIIECDNETPNITNGTVWVAFSAYTQLGQQQRQLANIEAGKLWWDIDGNPLSALAVTNPLSIGISKDFTINLYTPKGIVATKHVTPVKDGQPGQPGAQGIQGCIQRVTEWASGIEFHNDEELTSGTRFLDIAVITESATSFKAYKCLKTHISSSSNAPQAGVTTEYWEPFNSMAPIHTPMIMAQYALLRLTQTNQLLVMKADGKTVNAAMGGGNIPLWVGATEGAKAPFRVDENGKLHATGAEISGTINATDGTFKGKLNGVSGTFYKLSALDANGKEACTIYFSSDGHMTFEGDMYNQGYNNAQGRSYRFYTSDIMCRGLFGHRERYIAYVRGTYMTVYPKGTDKAGENVTLETQKLTDGTTCYKIPLYSPGTENSSGMPIDVVVFNTTADYYYLLTSWGNGKAVDLVNGNDSQTVHFCDQGGWHSFPGGASVHCVLIDNKKFTNPVLADTYPGLGVFWTGENDLNWTKR